MDRGVMWLFWRWWVSHFLHVNTVLIWFSLNGLGFVLVTALWPLQSKLPDWLDSSVKLDLICCPHEDSSRWRVAEATFASTERACTWDQRTLGNRRVTGRLASEGILVFCHLLCSWMTAPVMLCFSFCAVAQSPQLCPSLLISLWLIAGLIKPGIVGHPVSCGLLTLWLDSFIMTHIQQSEC